MIRPAYRPLTKLGAAASVLGIVLVSTACGVDHSDGEVSSAAQALSPISAESPVDELSGAFAACTNHWLLAKYTYGTEMLICLDSLEQDLRNCVSFNNQYPQPRRRSPYETRRTDAIENPQRTDEGYYCDSRLREPGTSRVCIAACNVYSACTTAAQARKDQRYQEYRACNRTACDDCTRVTGVNCCPDLPPS
jgi:hypothetical protein